MGDFSIAVLASGRGTDFQSIIDAVVDGSLPVRIALLLTNNPDAYAIRRAEDNDIPHRVVGHRGRSREEFESELTDVLDGAGVDLVVLAGFMRILTPFFTDRFEGRLINIHPSLLPSFPGAHAHRDALEYGVKVSGCTVHFVTSEVDGGPVIIQEAVRVEPGDTEETLEKRVLEVEHRVLPRAIRLIALGKVKVSGRQVVVDPD